MYDTFNSRNRIASINLVLIDPVWYLAMGDFQLVLVIDLLLSNSQDTNSISNDKLWE